MDTNIFREYDIRGIVAEQLTDETVATLARAIGTFFAQNGAKRIAVGYDARKSSPGFCDLLTRGFNESGCDVVLVGMVPTPVLYHTVFTQNVDGGVMITGSHNPPTHNGFKICLGRSTLFGSQIQEIKDIALSGEFVRGEGGVESIDVLEAYCRDIVSGIDLGDLDQAADVPDGGAAKKRLRVVVDAGNGMGGVTAVPVYEALGVELVKLYTDPDSNFPNHHADPTVAENLEDTIAAVHEHKADIGIAFDGDADRIGVVDETGRIIWGDELMILLSRSILAANPGATIIAEVKCSQ
ncbi:MAG TPA: phosphomannomutase/phosphoglucomutase, partial [Pyrinomonadaceae bacterium]|nr:phosphomannomutase/phosphoglucomutase [Pyrinomonadaceae bacterium]